MVGSRFHRRSGLKFLHALLVGLFDVLKPLLCRVLSRRQYNDQLLAADRIDRTDGPAHGFVGEFRPIDSNNPHSRG